MSDYAGDIGPADVWTLMQEDPTAQLVDVRTLPEWNFVGVPDLSALGRQPLLLSWQRWPDMDVDDNFVPKLARSGLNPDHKIFFLCRSGVRSASAAAAATAAGFKHCYNIAFGFEGPHDAQRHRGTVAGWKQAGLPWTQG